LNKKRFNSRRKLTVNLQQQRSVGSVFQMCGAATAKARLPTVVSLTGGTTRRLALVEQSVRRPGKSWTWVSRPRYVVSILLILNMTSNTHRDSGQTATVDCRAYRRGLSSLDVESIDRNLGILRCSRRHVIGDIRRPASV